MTNPELIARIATAQQQLCAPGSPYEVGETRVAGRTMQVFLKAPANLNELVAPARAFGDREFLVYRGERWSFRQFFDHADALALAMQSRYGVRPGDRVAIAMRNRPEWLTAFIAAISIGATIVPLNSWGQREELLHGLTDSQPKLIVCDEARLGHIAGDLAGLGIPAIVADAAPSADPPGIARYGDLVARGGAPGAVEIDPDATALILYTSGTTSLAKGVMSSHRAICQALISFEYGGAVAGITSPEVVKEIMSLNYAPTVLTAVPLFHVSGLHAHFLFSLRSGRRMVMMYKWDVDEAVRLIAAERVTTFAASTAMVTQLLSAPSFAQADTRSLTAVGLGGSGVTRRALDLIEATRPNGMPGIGYGLTETNGVGTICAGRIFNYKPTSSGVALPITEIRTIDANGQPLPQGETGEICVRGVTVMNGYWNDAEATARVLQDGWFATGDVGYVDDEGFLFVVDRIKDIVNRGGEKIAMAEVEFCVSRMPAVAEVAAFSVPDAIFGEALGLAVRLKDGCQPDPEAIRAYVAEHLAAYKVPAHIAFVAEDMPRNPSGKLLRRALRDQVTPQLGG
jgi:long-chain acyl-CoA synthetase